MPIHREFLGWDEPALPAAVERLVKRYRDGQTLDLGRATVVVPGQRAGRRLVELLAFRAEDERLMFTPPRFVTEGRLAELLYTPKLPFASDLVQDLAWVQALQELPTEQLRHLVPHAPAHRAALGWLELGKVLRRLHVELAADGLDFTAIHAAGPKLPGFTESDRWTALVAAQQGYHGILDRLNLWDKQTARLVAIKKREIATDCDIILLATVDLNNSLRQMLDQIAERVTAYIIAPESLADHFDAHGCLIPERWGEATIPLREEHLRQADGPLEQSDSASQWLAELNGRYRVDEVAIGVPDETLVPQLQRQLAQRGVKARWVEGARLGETAPYRLLNVAVQFAGAQRYEDLAALVRHPDCEHWLRSKLRRTSGTASSLAAQLDCFYNRRLPTRVRANKISANPKSWPELADAVRHIEEWLVDAGRLRPLREWGDVFRKLLGDVYGACKVDLESPADEVLHRTILRILNACDDLNELPDAFDVASYSAPDAFQLVIGPLKDEALPPPADPNAVEILGWLELPLDDSPALLVTSFNEGFIAKSTGAESFLPDRLRKALNLEHNERRYARDAYATSVLCHSRKELRMLLARRDTNGDPLQPSRLVFGCSAADLVKRGCRYFTEHQPTAPARQPLLAGDGPIRERSLFEPPKPVPPRERLARLSVTRFKDYLACRYRYYLRHVRKLEAVDDSARELDGGAFGTLLHGVLSALGRNPHIPYASLNVIVDFLDAQLSEVARQRYGADLSRASIRLQVEQARLRLKTFAAHQAELAKSGWRIIHVETADDDEAKQIEIPFSVDSQAILLVGRIDRIDFHEERRVLRILDYKTADKAHTPDQTHRKKDAWIDLQLPLYRHLWRGLSLKLPEIRTVELGYFNLPKKLEEAGVAIADWGDVLLKTADAVAHQIIRDLSAGKFEPMADPPPKYSEDLSAICLDGVLGRRGGQENGAGGAE
jgi:ATP-dependent helicase/nuclease subunit B